MPPLKLDIHDIGYTYSFPPSIDEGGDSLTDEKYRAVLSFNPVKVDAVTVGSLIGKDSYLGKILSGEIANLSDLGDEYRDRLLKKEKEQAGYPGSSNTKEDAKAKALATSLKAKRSTENTTVRGKGKDDLGYPDNRYVHLYIYESIFIYI